MTEAELARGLAGRYTIERELGGGGMSRVYLATELAFARRVVLKVVPVDGGPLAVERFRREIDTAARLQHPHIVPVHSAGEVDGVPWFTMPYVAGESLRARLATGGPLPIGEATKLLRDVAQALAYAHGQGFVHRDIKPDNVLLADGAAMVTDFGVAKALARATAGTPASGGAAGAPGTALTAMGMALGTPAYMAPEQVSADPAIDHRADIYAWGCLSYEVLTGAPPFGQRSPTELFAAHLAETPAPMRAARRDVPAALEALIAQCLAKAPAARPQSARELLAVLDGVVTPSALTAPRVAARTRVVAAVLGLLVIIAAGVAFSRLRGGDRPTVAPGAEVIAVMPLSGISDTVLTRLGQDLVVTLSATLDGVGTLRTVDAATLLMRARTLPSPLPLKDAQGLATELGARSVLSGTLIREGDNVRATVKLHRLTGDTTLASASALAPPSAIGALTDSLTWQLLRQVWQTGKAPSPVLANVTTASFDALRAFLDGERAFQSTDMATALARYRRAIELDPGFAQAYMRHQFASAWAFELPDPEFARRLQTLAGRLSERDRAWVRVSNEEVTVPERYAHWRALADRYSDYQPLVMSAGDIVLHEGGWYGIPLRQAIPYFERVVQLAPEGLDGVSHDALMDVDSPDPASRARGVQRLLAWRTDSVAGPWANAFVAWAEMLSRFDQGAIPRLTPHLRYAMRGFVAMGPTNPGAFYAGVISVRYVPQRYVRAVVDSARAAGIYTGAMSVVASFGDVAGWAARGDWRRALDAGRGLAESGLAPSMRMQPARVAGFGVWLGTIAVQVADSVLGITRAAEGITADPESRVELRWLEGLTAVARGDTAAAQRARNDLQAMRTVVATHAARSLAGLLLVRTSPDAGADSLRSLSDSVMRTGGFLPAAEAIDRLVVSRSLRRRGLAASAERYLLFTDSAPLDAERMGVSISLLSLVAYERALVLEALGDRKNAAMYFRRALDDLDQPQGPLVAVRDDARARLVALTGVRR